MLIQLLILRLDSFYQGMTLLAYFILAAVLYHFWIRKDVRHATRNAYLIQLPVMVMAVLMGTVFDRSTPTFTLIPLLMSFPLFILDKPRNVLSYIAGLIILYAILCITIKDPSVAQVDLIHLSTYGVIALVTTTFVLSHRIQLVKKGITYKGDSEIDPLTGVYNRRGGEEKIRQFIEDQIPGLFISVDVDDFKLVNDHYGHDHGDQILASISTALKQHFRKDDVIMRIGGDEFVVYSPYLTQHKNADNKLCSLNREMTAMSDASDANKPITVSIGAVINNGNFHSYEDLFSEADKLLYEAKRRGKNAYCLSDEFNLDRQKINHQHEIRNYVVNHLEEAMDKGYIQVYFQPIMHATSKQVCSMEALARWIDPKHGFISPGEFIPALESARKIHKLDFYVIQEVCKGYRASVELGVPTIPISINLSRLDFKLADVTHTINQLTEKYGMPHDFLKIEITESMFVEDAEALQKEIRTFREDGYNVWMDDFGSGYSSLNILKDFDFDLIKIDMDFLVNMSERGRQIIRSVVYMAKRLGIQTLAEGVETEEQLEFLREVGCEKVQGYLFAKPLSWPELEVNMGVVAYRSELPEEINYYDTIGRVDMMKGCPTAILEYDEQNVGHYISCNKKFKKELEILGIYSLADSEKLLASGKNHWGKNLLEGCQKAKELGQSYTLDFVVNGVMEVMNINYLSSVNGYDAYSVDLTRVTQKMLAMGMDTASSAMEQIFSLFQYIFAFDLEEMTSRDLFRSRATLLSHDIPELPALIRAVSENNVHPDDKQRYLNFMEPRTIAARAADAEDGNLTEYIRLKQADGSYLWYGLELLTSGNGKECIHCVRYLREANMQDHLNHKYNNRA